ncbi:rhodanese-like domain-containing protein [Gemmatimonas aurantiaca]|nr:rhodanese-like domain-containing protein [Gemmatimonas aurantiaca]
MSLARPAFCSLLIGSLALAILTLSLIGCAKNSENKANVDTTETDATDTMIENSAVTDASDKEKTISMSVTIPSRVAEVTVAEVHSAIERGENVLLLDVRTQGEFEVGRVAEVFALIPYDELLENIDLLPEDKESYIYVICRSGRRSAIGTNVLRNIGYSHTYNVIGGMNAWGDAKYKIVSGPVSD